MSLNSITFDPNDIVLLFKNSLVEIDSKRQIHPTTSSGTEWIYLGGNKKATLVVVRYPGIVHIPDKQLGFLTKLLAACNLNPDDVAILNFDPYGPSDFDNVLNHFKPKAVLMFGIEPGDFGMPMLFPQFQAQRYTDVVFISSPTLETIEPDKTLKSKLWTCLKKIYNL